MKAIYELENTINELIFSEEIEINNPITKKIYTEKEIIAQVTLAVETHLEPIVLDEKGEVISYAELIQEIVEERFNAYGYSRG